MNPPQDTPGRLQVLAYDAPSPTAPTHGGDLSDWLAGSPFRGYSYGYPHKTAYGTFDEPVPLAPVWAAEDLSSLFLYVHVPFCEMRCGFCNLFTQAQPKDGLPDAYLDALERQVTGMRRVLGSETRFARLAVGGGTPTLLSPAALERLFDLVERFGTPVQDIPAAVETSPETASLDRLSILVERGVDRISIGIQSVVPAELKAMGRPQDPRQAEAALDLIRRAGAPKLNVDLIYGVPGQTPTTWEESLRRMLTWRPEEIFLYPLYLRPLTGLGKLGRSAPDRRMELYRHGRDLLLDAGYEQFSMRNFRLPETVPSPPYRCQEDGMVGLGCGARSYTRGLHYSDPWAVGARSVRQIIADWLERDEAAFEQARYGYRLDGQDRRRRYVLMSIFHRDGLDLAAYGRRFKSDAVHDVPQLAELQAHGLTTVRDDVLRLTERGLELSDVLGAWLSSPKALQRSREFALR